jgi:RNA polymerase sigma-70 factor (ECF subfamily)
MTVPRPEERRARLYQAHGRVVLAYCRRMLGSVHAAEDAVQETFLRVSRHADRVPEAEDALRWIYRVATNYCLNELRNSRLRRDRVSEWGTLELMTDRAPFDEALLVRDLVARMPRELSRVAWMYHVDGRDQLEIARALGVSRRTVVTRMSQFTREARALLAGEGRKWPGRSGSPRSPGTTDRHAGRAALSLEVPRCDPAAEVSRRQRRSAGRPDHRP